MNMRSIFGFAVAGFAAASIAVAAGCGSSSSSTAPSLRSVSRARGPRTVRAASSVWPTPVLPRLLPSKPGRKRARRARRWPPGQSSARSARPARRRGTVRRALRCVVSGLVERMRRRLVRSDAGGQDVLGRMRNGNRLLRVARRCSRGNRGDKRRRPLHRRRASDVPGRRAALARRERDRLRQSPCGHHRPRVLLLPDVLYLCGHHLGVHEQPVRLRGGLHGGHRREHAGRLSVGDAHRARADPDVRRGEHMPGRRLHEGQRLRGDGRFRRQRRDVPGR